MIIVLSYLNIYLGNFSILLQILIIIFNLLIYLTSLRENENDLINSRKNLKDIEIVTH